MIFLKFKNFLNYLFQSNHTRDHADHEARTKYLHPKKDLDLNCANVVQDQANNIYQIALNPYVENEIKEEKKKIHDKVIHS